MTTPLEYADQHRQTHLEELKALLRIPSISTDPEHAADIQAAAEWLAGSMRQAGLEHVRIYETAGHPLVYGDWLHAGPDRPTVLIYGHYDVQPADPLDLWETDPFEPVVRDDYILARGASDDKGQAFIHVKAVEAYLKTAGALPVNVKLILEGEEESGGASLTTFVAENKALLAADVAVISDTSLFDKDQPRIVYGLRGMVYALVDVVGPTRDLHSGSAGGVVNNPINALAHIIAALKDEHGRILIPGFYDEVRPLSDDERAVLAGLPERDTSLLAYAGAPQLWGEPGYTVLERIGARPTLDVNGIVGGYTGAGAKTVLPSKVHAKISMRLVPDQDPEAIFQQFKAYVEEIAPPSVTVSVSYFHSAQPAITDLTIPAMDAARVAYLAEFGNEPLFSREGGSIPVVSDFQRELGLETVMMGFGLPDDRLHSPNERFYLPNFYKGIRTAIRFLDAYGS